MLDDVALEYVPVGKSWSCMAEKDEMLKNWSLKQSGAGAENK